MLFVVSVLIAVVAFFAWRSAAKRAGIDRDVGSVLI